MLQTEMHFNHQEAQEVNKNGNNLVKNQVFNTTEMDELIKLAKLKYQLEQQKLKTSSAVHYAFKHEEDFLKMKNTIIDSMIMAGPQGCRAYILSTPSTYPRWRIDTREKMTDLIDSVQRLAKFEKKKAPKPDVEIVNQPEAKRQRTD